MDQIKLVKMPNAKTLQDEVVKENLIDTLAEIRAIIEKENVFAMAGFLLSPDGNAIIFQINVEDSLISAMGACDYLKFDIAGMND